MRREQELVLDERDEEIVRLLGQLGVPLPASRAVVFLSHVREATSAQIEVGTGLRQPEVSVGMQHLRSRGWAGKRDLKREGKGRPIHAYGLLRALSAVIDEVEKERKEAAERDLDAISRLRKIVTR